MTRVCFLRERNSGRTHLDRLSPRGLPDLPWMVLLQQNRDERAMKGR